MCDGKDRSPANRMPKYYLDTHIFSYMTDPSKKEYALGRRVKELVNSGSVAILGSVELLEEFAQRAEHDAQGYKHMVSLFWAFCGQRVLRPWNQLSHAEIRKGLPLSLDESYVDRPTVKELRKQSDNYKLLLSCVHDIKKDKEKYESSMTGAAQSFDKIATQRWGHRMTKKLASQLAIDQAQIRDWANGIFLKPDPVRFGLTKDEAQWPDLTTLPCTRAWTSATIALCKKCHANKRKAKGGDMYDVAHYALAAMGDGLVTGDGPFRDTIGLIQWKPVPVYTPAEFEGRLVRNALPGITRNLVDALHPERIYLFGSHAYGSPRADSDLDIMVIVKDSIGPTLELRRLARRAVGDIGRGVDVVVRTVTEFDDRASWPANFEFTIKAKGHVLYG